MHEKRTDGIKVRDGGEVVSRPCLLKLGFQQHLCFLLNGGLWDRVCPFAWNLILFSGKEQGEEVTMARHVGTERHKCFQSLSLGSHAEGCQEMCRTGILTSSLTACSDIFINWMTTLGPTFDNKGDDNQKTMLWVHTHKWYRWPRSRPSLEGCSSIWKWYYQQLSRSFGSIWTVALPVHSSFTCVLLTVSFTGGLQMLHS